MAEVMTFPNTVEEFMEGYKVVDTDHVYSNGTEYVPIFRMKQWFDHIDTVEVVRCGECKWWRKDSDHTCRHHSLVSPMCANDFCSYGERINKDA